MSKPVEFPLTIYAGSLVFGHRSADGRVATCSHLEMVSGKNPLTADELRARAEAEARKNWATNFPAEWKSDEYVLRYWHFQSATIERSMG